MSRVKPKPTLSRLTGACRFSARVSTDRTKPQAIPVWIGDAPQDECGAESIGDTVNLRSVRSTDNNEAKPSPDPKAPHIFQEGAAVQGGGVCAVCSRSKSDPHHLASRKTRRLAGTSKRSSDM